MTDQLHAERPLSGIRLDHTTVEDLRELDIVAQEVTLYLKRGELAAVKAFFIVQEIADIASLFEQMEPEDAAPPCASSVARIRPKCSAICARRRR